MGIPFTIVGIVEASGSALESEGVGRQVAPGEMAAFVPQSLLGLWAERNPVSPGEIGAVFVRAGDARPLPETLALARRLLGDAGGGSAGLRWITPDTVLRGTRRLQTTLVYTVGSVAALCLILGGTTLMSLMIANVRDRVTEIGLRRALGATPADVAAMFLLESCLVAGSAALLGAGLTHGLLWLGREQFPVALRLDALTLLAPVVLALLLAGVFSYGPARLAASIAPADALRAE
jgi:putative ABC transport system permease protein